ncbi:MAG: Mrp/NBP35 family ATP-binding protein [Oscillospiraceae bacterium]|nr:Mrp/NBP35 family ATP-binding protein [Oscillospiraceae bacterium]
MSEQCSGNCSSCSENCESRDLKSFQAAPNKKSNVKNVIAVMSGKGGVGKSTVTSLLAVAMAKRGFRVGILDADITGPSIPKAFGIREEIIGTDDGMIPATSGLGISIMSMNLLLPNPDEPVVWRGPVIGGAVKQFWTDVCWGDIDFLFVDMPPGTGDVPLTVFQSLPVTGTVVVTSPQDLVSMIVKKAVTMAQMMQVPVVGFVENYAYFECPDCGKKTYLFGESKLDEAAKAENLPVLARLPINPEVARLCDSGKIEQADLSAVASAADALEKMK